MTLEFRVNGRIGKPVAEVFDAVVNPEKLSGYFTTIGGASARIWSRPRSVTMPGSFSTRAVTLSPASANEPLFDQSTNTPNVAFVIYARPCRVAVSSAPITRSVNRCPSYTSPLTVTV